jgi:hypothetical protein
MKQVQSIPGWEDLDVANLGKSKSTRCVHRQYPPVGDFSKEVSDPTPPGAKDSTQ